MFSANRAFNGPTNDMEPPFWAIKRKGRIFSLLKNKSSKKSPLHVFVQRAFSCVDCRNSYHSSSGSSIELVLPVVVVVVAVVVVDTVVPFEDVVAVTFLVVVPFP